MSATGSGGVLGLPSEVSCALGVVCAIASAAATVVGMLLQKVGLERENNTLFRLGVFVFTAVKPGGQIIALYFAPVSLVAPLASVTILLNVAIVPYFRAEKLSQRGAWTSILLVLGCVGSTVAGSHSVRHWSQPELLGLASAKLGPTVALATLLGFSTVMLIACQAHPNLLASSSSTLALAAVAPSVASALNNVFLKVLLSLGWSFWMLPLVLATACSAFLQVWSTTKGVKLFDMLRYVPVQMAEQILVTTVYSMYVFDEAPSNPTLFLVSSATLIIGVLISQTTPAESADTAEYRALEDGQGTSEPQKQPRYWIRVEGDYDARPPTSPPTKAQGA